MLKRMKFGPLPPEIEENPRSRTPLAELGLWRRVQGLLAEAGFETASGWYVSAYAYLCAGAYALLSNSCIFLHWA